MSDTNYAYPNAAQGTVVTVSAPQHAYPNAAQGYHQPPPVMAPPQYYAPPPPGRKPGFLEGCLAALRCCDLINECCSDPSISFMGP